MAYSPNTLGNTAPTHEPERLLPSFETLINTLPLQEGRYLDNRITAIEFPLDFIEGDERLLRATDFSYSHTGKGLETADIIYAYPDGSFVIEPDETETPIFGTERNVSVACEIQYLDGASRHGKSRVQTQNRFVAALRHTHGLFDSPTSPIDLSTILVEDAYPGAHAFTYVVTHKKTTLVFRTEETPQFKREDILPLMHKQGEDDRILIRQLVDMGNIDQAREMTQLGLEINAHDYKLRIKDA